MSPESTIPRALASRIDHYALHEPGKTYMSVTRQTEAMHFHVRDVTYQEFARAINQACWWLDRALGDGHETFEAFTYFGPPDLRWTILFVAGIKTRRQMLCCSPWAPNEGLLSLINACDCKAILYAAQDEKVHDLLDCCNNVKRVEVPTLQDWLPDTAFTPPDVQHYEYNYAYDKVLDDPIGILHTAGSTGLPKPVSLTNRRVACYANVLELGEKDPSVIVPSPAGGRTYSTFYIGHIGGMSLTLFYPVYCNSISIMGPPNLPITTELFDKMYESITIDAVYLTPSLLCDISAGPSLDRLRTIPSIYTAGAPLSDRIASAIGANNGPTVQMLYGSTETAPIVQRSAPSCKGRGGHWNHISFHENSNLIMRHVVADLHEPAVLRDADLAEYQPCFHSFPKAHHFPMRDLFSPAPSCPGSWIYRGRLDATIVLANGQNVFVADLESALEEHPSVGGAIIGGTGHERPFVLIEKTEPDKVSTVQEMNGNERKLVTTPSDGFLKDLQPAIEAANALVTENARLLPHRTFVIAHGRRLPRTTKGNVERRTALNMYESEVPPF